MGSTGRLNIRSKGWCCSSCVFSPFRLFNLGTLQGTYGPTDQKNTQYPLNHKKLGQVGHCKMSELYMHFLPKQCHQINMYGKPLEKGAFY